MEDMPGTPINGQRRHDSGEMLMALEINTDTIAEAVVSRLKDSAVLTPRLLTLKPSGHVPWVDARCAQGESPYGPSSNRGY